MRNRIVRSPVVAWFLPEYLNELQIARRENEGSAAARLHRLEQLDQEVANVLKQVRVGAVGYAAQLLNQNLEALGAERDRLQRDERKPRISEPAELISDEVVAKLRVFFDEFAQALRGDGRDAARARDIIRSMIDRIEITPVGPPNQRAGSVEIMVEGQIAALLDPVILNRKTLPVCSTEDRQGLPSPGYRFHGRIDPPLSKRTLRLQHDGEIAGTLIREVERPVSMSEIAAELSKTPDFSSLRSENPLKRAEAAMRGLKREGVAATDRRGSHAKWVLLE